jgi:hypothetical protein
VETEPEAPIDIQVLDPNEFMRKPRVPLLSEGELIEQIIEFANTGDSSSYAMLWTGIRVPKEVLAEAHSIFSQEGQPPIEPEHLALREDLAAIVAGTVTREMRDMWRRHAAGLALVMPAFNEDGSVQYRYAVFAWFRLPPSPPLAYIQLLLLNSPKCGELCQCKLDSCGKFFLAARPTSTDRKGEQRGRTIRDYCPGSNHRNLAHQAAAVERMRKSRQRASERAALNQRRRR